MDQLALKDRLEIEVRLDLWDLRARLEMWAGLDHLASRALGDHQAGLDQEGQVDLQENLVSQDRMERMESPVLKVFRAFQGQWGPLETKDQWESRAVRVILVCLGSKDLEEIQERMALLAAQGHLALLDQLEREELQVAQDLVVSRGCLDLLVRMVHLARMEQQGCRDHLA